MKLAILLLTAALGSASPVRTQNSIQGRDGQNACDCSRLFQTSVSELESCPAGYKNISYNWIPDCVQINCSANDYKTQCSAKPQDTTPTAVVEEPTNKPTDLSEQNACDCSRLFQTSVPELDSCPAGYKDIGPSWIPECVQINCSANDYKAQCNAKQDAKPEASPCT